MFSHILSNWEFHTKQKLFLHNILPKSNHTIFEHTYTYGPQKKTLSMIDDSQSDINSSNHIIQ